MTDIALITAAAERLALAKDAEHAATAARIAAESDLEHLVPAKPEGSTTTHVPGWKITVTGVINRTVDQEALQAIRSTVPPALFDQAFRYKAEPITAGLKFLQSNEPATYAVVAQALTARPGKTAVKVERVADEAKAA